MFPTSAWQGELPKAEGVPPAAARTPSVAAPPSFLRSPPSFLRSPPSFLRPPPSFLRSPPSFPRSPPSSLRSPPSFPRPLRHSRAPSVIPALPSVVPALPSVIPAPPPSFLRRQESRRAKAHRSGSRCPTALEAGCAGTASLAAPPSKSVGLTTLSGRLDSCLRRACPWLEQGNDGADEAGPRGYPPVRSSSVPSAFASMSAHST